MFQQCQHHFPEGRSADSFWVPEQSQKVYEITSAVYVLLTNSLSSADIPSWGNQGVGLDDSLRLLCWLSMKSCEVENRTIDNQNTYVVALQK